MLNPHFLQAACKGCQSIVIIIIKQLYGLEFKTEGGQTINLFNI